ncbi:MAG TPA: hypothetical protein VJT08_07515 [Terriglobales bacterium]|nr:hypothetical protein [Terriglobales bacterium]
MGDFRQAVLLIWILTCTTTLWRAVVQVHGMSRLQFNYINPDDDPSRKK